MNTTFNTPENLGLINQRNGLKRPGKCGWICRTLRGIAGVVANVPIVGTALAAELTIASDIVSAVESLFFRSGAVNKTNTQEYEPTDYELSILEPWQLTKLTPFYESLSMELKNAFNQHDLALQIANANAILNKMCIVTTYFAQYETTGLSIDAINMRNALIQQLFEPLYVIVENSFASSNLVTFASIASVNSENANQFNNLLPPTANLKTSCENYKENGRIILASLDPIKIKLPGKEVANPNLHNPSEVSEQLPGKTVSNKSVLFLISSVAVFLYVFNHSKKE